MLLPIGPVGAAAAGSPSADAIAAAEDDALEMINRKRAAAGLAPLRRDSRLGDIAGERSAYMASSGVFSHTHRGGISVFDIIEARDIEWYGAGEIIAWNNASDLDYSVAFAVKGWMDSPGHKAIIMSRDYNYVAFGLALAADGKRYWTGVFLKGPDRTAAWARITSTAESVVDADTMRVVVRWEGGDRRLQVLTSGLRLYETQRRAAGGSWQSLGTTTLTYASRWWTRGVDGEFRVRARDKAGNWGAWQTVTIRP